MLLRTKTMAYIFVPVCMVSARSYRVEHVGQVHPTIRDQCISNPLFKLSDTCAYCHLSFGDSILDPLLHPVSFSTTEGTHFGNPPASKCDGFCHCHTVAFTATQCMRIIRAGTVKFFSCSKCVPRCCFPSNYEVRKLVLHNRK